MQLLPIMVTSCVFMLTSEISRSADLNLSEVCEPIRSRAISRVWRKMTAVRHVMWFTKKSTFYIVIYKGCTYFNPRKHSSVAVYLNFTSRNLFSINAAGKKKLWLKQETNSSKNKLTRLFGNGQFLISCVRDKEALRFDKQPSSETLLTSQGFKPSWIKRLVHCREILTLL